MASKSVAKLKLDWSKIANSLCASDLGKFNKFKSQVDSTAVKVASLPDSLPKLDWSYYKRHSSDPKMVEEIEKQYASIKLDVPKAPESRWKDLAEAKEGDLERFEKFVVVAKSHIESIEIVKEKFKKMIPIKDMTAEEFALTFPKWSFSIENPSIAPHYGRTPGLTKEEAIAFEQPDPLPYSTKKAWADWEIRKKKFYS